MKKKGRYVMNAMESDHGLVLAICDFSLLGRVIEEGDRVLDLSCSFFSEGKERDIEEIINHIKIAHSVNIVGNEIVDLLMSYGILQRERIKSINGVKYSHIYRM